MEILLPVRGFAFYRGLQDNDLLRLRTSNVVTTKQEDVRTNLSKIDLLGAVARTLEVPEVSLVNINYDFFDEAISNLSWLEFSNSLVVLIGCCTQWACNYAAMSAVLEICADAHMFWRDQGMGFFVALVD
jgi:hypothetical protein